MFCPEPGSRHGHVFMFAPRDASAARDELAADPTACDCQSDLRRQSWCDMRLMWCLLGRISRGTDLLTKHGFGLLAFSFC